MCVCVVRLFSNSWPRPRIGPASPSVGFCSPSRQRTASARCVEDCLVLSVNQSTVKELYYQNPAFGFELVGLVAGRLTADVARLQEQLARTQATV